MKTIAFVQLFATFSVIQAIAIRAVEPIPQPGNFERDSSIPDEACTVTHRAVDDLTDTSDLLKKSLPAQDCRVAGQIGDLLDQSTLEINSPTETEQRSCRALTPEAGNSGQPCYNHDRDDESLQASGYDSKHPNRHNKRDTWVEPNGRIGDIWGCGGAHGSCEKIKRSPSSTAVLLPSITQRSFGLLAWIVSLWHCGASPQQSLNVSSDQAARSEHD